MPDGPASDQAPTFVTIATSDYAAQARVFARSARACHPTARLAVLSLGPDSPGVFADAFDLVVTPDQLALGCFADLEFRYSVRELCFALKPWVMRHLAERFPGAPVYYLDSDIEVFSRLVEVEDTLAHGASVILMPHILHPAASQEGDEALLRSGTFNGGFLAVAPTPQGRAFIDWWGERLKTGCTIDATCGDQKWLDLVPSVFDEAAILRHPGYNFAFWNAHQRPLSRVEDQWIAAGRPLRFVHYTQWKLREQDWRQYLAAYFHAIDQPFAELYANYQEKVRREEGFAGGNRGGAYRPVFCPSGAPVPDLVRYAYAQHGPSIDGPASEVFAGAVAVLNAPSKARADLPLPVTVLYDLIWQHRAELRHSFDIDELGGRLTYLRWLAAKGAAELALPREFVAPARAALASDGLLRQPGAEGTAATPEPAPASSLPAGLAATALEWLPIMTVGSAGERGDAGISAKVGASGHLVYGPYARLDAGTYRLRIGMRAEPPPGGIQGGAHLASIEAVTGDGKTYLAQRRLTLRDCATPEHELRFRIAEQVLRSRPVEVRVWTSGIAPLTISSVKVERIG